jgi:ligand-binding sensor domain-containing protein
MVFCGWLPEVNPRFALTKNTGHFDEPVKTGTKNVQDLVLDKEGTIWAGRQGGGLLKVNTKDLSYQADERYANFVCKLAACNSEFSIPRSCWQYLGTAPGTSCCFVIIRFTQKEESFCQSNDPYSFPNDDILSFAEDQSGRIWMGGRYDGLTIFNPAQNKFYNYRYDVTLEGSVADNHISSVFIDRSGMIWMGTNKGVSIYNPAQQSFVQTFLPQPDKNITIYDFYTDAVDNLWIGTSEGLFVKQAASNSFEVRKLNYKGTPLIVSKIFADSDGKIYFGTNFSLFLYDPSSGQIKLLPNTEKDKVMYDIIESRVVSIVRDTIDGHPVLWASPYGHYLSYYDLLDMQWVSRTDTMKNILARFNLLDNLVRKIYKTRSGYIYLATGKYGLGQWKKGSMPR